MSNPGLLVINHCPHCGVLCQKNGKFCIECGVCFVKQCRSCRGSKNVCGWWERCTFCGRKMYKPNESEQVVLSETVSESETVIKSETVSESESASISTESEEASSCSEESTIHSEVSSSYSDESSTDLSSEEEDEEEEKQQQKKRIEKVEVNVGILIDDIPVSKSNGGGYGCLKLAKLETSLALIFDRMKDLYFPEEGTPLGKRANYNIYLLDFKKERIENAHFKSLDHYMRSNGLDFTSKLFFLQIFKKKYYEKTNAEKRVSPTKRSKRKADTSSSSESDSSRSPGSDKPGYDSKKIKRNFVETFGKRLKTIR